MIDFSLPKDLVTLRDRADRIIRDNIIPAEHDPYQGSPGPTEVRRKGAVEHPGAWWSERHIWHTAKKRKQSCPQIRLRQASCP
jgi:hypothetical protein